MTRTGTRRRSIVAIGQSLLAVAVLSASGFLLGALPGNAAIVTDGLVEVTKWRAFKSDSAMNGSALVVDNSARIAYAFSGPGQGAPPLDVQAWNIDSFRPIGPALTGPVRGAVQAATPIVVDERHHAVYVGRKPVSTGQVAVVDAVGVRDGATKLLGSVTTRFPATHVVVGIGVDAARDAVYVLATSRVAPPQAVAPPAGQVLVDKWKASDLATGRLAPAWTAPYTVPAQCSNVGDTSFHAALVVAKDGKSIFFTCVGTRGIPTTLGPNANDVAGVVEITMPGDDPSAFGFDLRPVPGNLGLGDSFGEANVGVLVIISNVAGRTSFKVFDVNRRRFIGNVGVGDLGLKGFAINRKTGRAYYVVAEALGVLDIRVAPVPQGRLFPEFRNNLGGDGRTLAVDVNRRLLYLPTSDDPVNRTKPFILVIRDTRPPVLDEVEDLDGGAVDLVDQAGKTEANWLGEAQGYGVEGRMVGGPQSLLVNTMHFDSRSAGVRSGTRQMYFAQGRGVYLSGDESAAETTNYRQDDATTTDLSEERFADPVRCLDFGGEPTTAKDDTANVSCNLAKESTSGSSSYGAVRVFYNAPPPKIPQGPSPAPSPPTIEDPDRPELPEAFRVNSSSYTGSVTRGPNRGPVKVEALAEAYGIDLMGLVQIGRISARATAETNGRSGTAKSSYTRTVSGVVVQGTDLCGTSCSLNEVAARINQLLVGRMRVEFPDPATLVTPRGTVARTQQNEFQHIENIVMNQEVSEQVALPAMVVTLYTEGTDQSRTLVNLAAVAANAQYRVYPLGSDSGGGDDDGDDPGDSGTPDGTGEVGGPAVDGGDPPATDPTGPVVAQPNDGGDESLAGTVARVVRGLRLLSRSPRDAAAVATVWALLALPVYLAARRRLLLEMPSNSSVEVSS